MREKVKQLLVKYPNIDKNIRYLLSTYRWYKRRIVGYKAPRMLKGELNFFKAIYSDCGTIVDVGARFDIDYVDISQNNNIKYFLFEANPKFFKKLTENLKNFKKENIVAENIAIGEKEAIVEYYEDSESLLQNTTAVKNSNKIMNGINMIRLDRYFNKININNIDFLKTDIEEYDFFALLGGGELLQKCKYIQFELGIGAQYKDRVVDNNDYFDLLNKKFNLYILQDENNPYLQNGYSDKNLFELNERSKKIIKEAQSKGIGFNIVAINKDINNINLKIGIL